MENLRGECTGETLPRLASLSRLGAMHRTDAPGNDAGLFTEGDPYGTPATGGAIVSADWLNDVQENLAEVVEGAGLTLEKGNYGQLLEAVKSLAADYFYRGREMIAQARTSVSVEASTMTSISSPDAAWATTRSVTSRPTPS